jgi:hypothetical protein
MGEDKRDLIDVLNTSVRELRQRIDVHCCLVTSIWRDGWTRTVCGPSWTCAPGDRGN